MSRILMIVCCGLMLSVSVGGCRTVESGWESGGRMTRQAATSVHGMVLRQDAPGSLEAVGGAGNLEDVVMSPMTDLNLRKVAVPPVLLGMRDPYVAVRHCMDVVVELRELDVALGPDYDVDAPDSTRVDAVGQESLGLIKGAVSDLIPFRSVVRRITGATARERDLRQAYRMGTVRRGYLRGVAKERECGASAPLLSE